MRLRILSTILSTLLMFVYLNTTNVTNELLLMVVSPFIGLVAGWAFQEVTALVKGN